MIIFEVEKKNKQDRFDNSEKKHQQLKILEAVTFIALEAKMGFRSFLVEEVKLGNEREEQNNLMQTIYQTIQKRLKSFLIQHWSMNYLFQA